MRLPAGLLRRIHVNQGVIRSNGKAGTDEPVLTVKSYNSNDYAHEVVIYGQDGLEAARVIYRPHDPLSCGAKVWIESRGQVDLVVRDTASSQGCRDTA